MSAHKITRLLASVATAALLIPLAACGGSDTGSAAKDIPAEGTDDGTEISLWTRFPLERQAKNAVTAYNSSHKNQVKLEIIPNDDMEGKVSGASQIDALPDILALDVVRIPYWASQGIFTDITEQIDGLANKDDLQQGHIDAGTVDGAKYTLPFVTDVSVMVWNKDLYRQAGLDPDRGPTTIEEYEEQAKAVAGLNRGGVSGSYLAGQSGGALVFTLFPHIWADGEEVLSDDGSEALLDSDAAQRVYSLYRDLADTPNGLGEGSQEETGATWTAPFAEGSVGVMPYPNTSATALFEDADFEVGVAPIPGSTQGTQSTFLGGDALGISKDCANVAQAWNFLVWLESEDAQQEVFADNGETASNLKVLESGYADADERVKTINSMLEHGRTPVAANFHEGFSAAGSPWQTLIQDQVWGDAAKLEEDNQALTDVLS